MTLARLFDDELFARYSDRAAQCWEIVRDAWPEIELHEKILSILVSSVHESWR